MKFLKSLAFVLLCGLFVNGCAATVHDPRISYLDDSRNFSHLQNATAALIAEGNDEHESYINCAAEFISQDEVLTAAHCVRTPPHMVIDWSTMTIRVIAGENLMTAHVLTFHENQESTEHLFERSHLFDVVARDNDRDLALLRAHSIFDVGHDVLRLPTAHTQSDLSVHQAVSAMGHPGGIPFVFSDGHIAVTSYRMAEHHNHEFIIVNSQIFFGDSGGPMVDNQGNLIGVASFVVSSGDSVATWLGGFVSANEIYNFVTTFRRCDQDRLLLTPGCPTIRP